MLLFFVPQSRAWGTENVLHAFSFTDGYDPESGVVLDNKGNLYGATFYGGTGSACTSGCGVIFRLERDASGDWTESTIYTFSGGADGNHPFSPLTIDGTGNLYGTTYGDNNDGGSGLGTVFKLSPASDGTWSFRTLKTFVGGRYGSRPEGSLVLDHVGRIYGLTIAGGRSDAGIVFQLSPTTEGEWNTTVVSDFSPKQLQHTGLLIDHSDNLYLGASPLNCKCGVIAQLSPLPNSTWKQTMLHSFSLGQVALLAQDAAGTLYGSTFEGVADRGILFTLKPSAGSSQYSILRGFDSGFGSPTAITVGPRGNLYGVEYTTLQIGGIVGMIIELTPGDPEWNLHTLYVFHDSFDGGYPVNSIVRDGAGNLYGTATFGGATGDGVVYQIAP